MVAFNGYESCIGDKLKELFRTSAAASGLFSQILTSPSGGALNTDSLMLNPSELCHKITNFPFSVFVSIKTFPCRKYGGNPGWFCLSPALQELVAWSCTTCVMEGWRASPFRGLQGSGKQTNGWSAWQTVWASPRPQERAVPQIALPSF